KKRTEKEKEGLVAFGIETLACGLFPILDDFERALESQTDKVGSFYEGISMIYEQLLKLLDKNEIKEIDALHQPFDPNFHNAMSMEESEEYEEGTIIQVYQKGYMLKDKVIRPAAVIVAK
ncbi:MAG TPA: nucleotide exchange factor GrpE, partial [Tissierellaceae bacterium]|nr:nucleotide exchange factor GrpE [Tissierellaceae bacterium]